MPTKLESLLNKSRPSVPAPHPLPRQGRAPDLARFLPYGLLLGFLILAWLLFGTRLLPAREVELGTVVTLRSTMDAPVPTNSGEGPGPVPQAAGLLFQASGWIEPAPYPIRASALTSGFIEEVRILEGEQVRQGQVLATLVSADIGLERAAAEAELGQRLAQLNEARESTALVRAQQETQAQRVAAAEARLQELRDLASRLSKMGPQVTTEREIAQSTLRVKTQEAEIATLRAVEVELRRTLARQKAAEEQLESALGYARVQLEKQELALERTRIRSPLDGIIQRLLVAPGQKIRIEADHPESTTIALLYQPQHLQARIDVPLELAAQLSVGQPVRIRTAFLPDAPLSGRVSRITGEADLQRNTLQAKVAIDNPDPRLRPEMLCRAEFFTHTQDKTTQRSGTAHLVVVYVPSQALADRGPDKATAWALDADGTRLERRDVSLGNTTREGHLAVLSGLRPGDRVVLNPPDDLREGERVKARMP